MKDKYLLSTEHSCKSYQYLTRTVPTVPKYVTVLHSVILIGMGDAKANGRWISTNVWAVDVCDEACGDVVELL